MVDKTMNRLLLVLALTMAVAASGLVLGDDDHEKSRRLMEAGEILPLQKILGRVESERTGRVLEVELEHERGRYIYEIELLAEDGRVWEYEIDATSGEVLERELED